MQTGDVLVEMAFLRERELNAVQLQIGISPAHPRVCIGPPPDRKPDATEGMVQPEGADRQEDALGRHREALGFAREAVLHDLHDACHAHEPREPGEPHEPKHLHRLAYPEHAHGVRPVQAATRGEVEEHARPIAREDEEVGHTPRSQVVPDHLAEPHVEPSPLVDAGDEAQKKVKSPETGSDPAHDPQPTGELNVPGQDEGQDRHVEEQEKGAGHAPGQGEGRHRVHHQAALRGRRVRLAAVRIRHPVAPLPVARRGDVAVVAVAAVGAVERKAGAHLDISRPCAS
mmetsp:Transcript_28450/g.88486  ORF Transcript_28450/g.88486 Transcript_28450/m.88486 type:complete len:286 (+) Transcript_28450:1706-2563(+)